MSYDTNRTNISLSNIGVRAPNTAPATGSIIYVPAAGGGWDELVISVPAANVRNVLGIDNGETAPSWKTTLDATTPAAVDATGSPGTSLIYSHRDHVHPQDTALTAIDFLVGTATGELSNEIVAGTTPGGELGGTWASPTVDATHSGSAHHTQSHDHSAAGDGTTLTPAILNIPNAAAPTPTAEGQAYWDNDDNKLVVGDGAAQKHIVPTASFSGDATVSTAGAVTVAATHSGSAHHSAVTLASDADTILSLSTQEIGLDTQSANTVFAGPTSGGAADPTFRAIVAADITSHGARIYDSGASQSITDSTHTMPTFDSEVFDTDGYHSTVSNTSRITIPTGLGGKYMVVGKARWATNTTGYRVVGVRKNAVLVEEVRITPVSGDHTMHQVTYIASLAAGDYVELNVWQNSTSSLNLQTSSENDSSLTAIFLGA